MATTKALAKTEKKVEIEELEEKSIVELEKKFELSPLDDLPKGFSVDSVMKNFPLPQPRQVQKDAIAAVVETYQKGNRFSVLEAPVGTGKSAIAVAIARTLGSSYMLTLTEQLQDQYLHDFKQFGLSALKGRGKFQCNQRAGFTCSDGKHYCKSPKDRGGCPYQIAKALAFKSPHIVANYHSYLANAGMQEEPTRDLIILDEAHSVEAFLLDNVSLTVRRSELGGDLPDFPEKPGDPTPYFSYMEEILIPYLKELLKKEIDPKIQEQIGHIVGRVFFVLKHRHTEEWIAERETDRDGNVKKDFFTMKPLTVKSFGHFVWGYGERQLFMSGTILNAWQFCDSIGLDLTAGDHVVLPCPFPVENRPIYAGRLSMERKDRDESWPIAAKTVDKLMSAAQHYGQKGIVLAPSTELLRFTAKNLSERNRRRFLIAAGENRMEKYNEHIRSKEPTVLAAAGFWEGADLKGDLSNFQIIMAVPRPYFQGQIEARTKRDTAGQSWYRWLTWVKFLQGIGRSVRSETDEAVTYCFDRDLLRELKRRDTMIPPWVAEAIKEVG